MKNYITGLVSSVFALSLLLASLLPASVSAAGAGGFWLAPSSTEVNVGDEFSVIIIASTNGTIDEVNVRIDWAGGLVEATGFDPTGSSFPDLSGESSANTGLANTHSLFQRSTTQPVSTVSERVVELFFTAKAPGEAVISIDTTSARTVEAGTGNNIFSDTVFPNNPVTITVVDPSNPSPEPEPQPTDDACVTLAGRADTIIDRIFDRTSGQLDTIGEIDDEVQEFGNSQNPPVEGYQEVVDEVDANNEAANSALLSLATAGLNCADDIPTQDEIDGLVIAIQDVYNSVSDYRSSVVDMIEVLQGGL